MIDRLELGLIIKKIRLEKNLTQEQVAGHFMSTRHYINVEKNKVVPSIEMLNYICTRLQISIEELFYRQYLDDYIKLEKLHSLISTLYNNDNILENVTLVKKQLNDINNINVLNSVDYKFFTYLIDFYEFQDTEIYRNQLHDLIIKNSDITKNLDKKINQKVVIEFIQICSYSNEALDFIEQLDCKTNKVICYVINTRYILKKEWKKIIQNCISILKSDSTSDFFIMPGLLCQLGIAYVKIGNFDLGIDYIKIGLFLYEFYEQTYFYTGTKNLLQDLGIKIDNCDEIDLKKFKDLIKNLS